MKKLTRKIVALTLSLVMCISFSNTTFAYADNENISSSAEASKVNWFLNLTFDVLNVGNYQGITFESLDYFEAAYAHNNGAAYPNIQDYQ